MSYLQMDPADEMRLLCAFIQSRVLEFEALVVGSPVPRGRRRSLSWGSSSNKGYQSWRRSRC
jgi:hypothetical protein